VSRAFSGAFRKPFQKAFAAPDAAAAAPAFSPTDLTGLKLWYKPRALSLSDNDPISTNTDYSGNTWDATAVTTARPTFKTNIVNGLAIARYDGSANVMTVSSGANGITNNVASATIVSVFATDTVTGSAAKITLNILGGTGLQRANLEMNRSTGGRVGVRVRRLDADSANQTDGGTTLSTSTFYIGVAQINYGTSATAIYVNGGSADGTGNTGGTGNTSATSSTAIALGANGVSNLWDGDLGDQLVYVPALSLSDLNLLGAYLGTTYGLTWTTAT
jgi:hypothetical protein